MAATRAEQRIESMLFVGVKVCLALIAAVAAVYVAGYRSDRPSVGPWSWRYLAAVVASLTLLSAAALTISAARVAALRLRVPRRVQPVVPVAALAVLGGAAWLGAGCPEPHGAVALPLLAAGVALELAAPWYAATRLLMTGLVVLAPAAMLFLAELPPLLWGPPVVTWGGPDCFVNELFPTRPPFIGPGGRLRPDLDARMRAPEYPRGARIVTDHLGLRGRGGDAPPPGDDTARVLVLGDSFAAGFGADQDRYFGSFLERELAAQGHACEVLTAEVSDPAYGLCYLQTYGLALRPRVVLYGLCGNDVMQAHWFAGARGRFRLVDGRIVANPAYDGDPVDFFARYEHLAFGRPGPAAAGAGPAHRPRWLESLARFQLLAILAQPLADLPHPAVPTRGFTGRAPGDACLRLLDGGANVGFYCRAEPPEIAAMYGTFAELLAAMDASCRAAGVSFALVIFPQRHQVQPADWDALCRTWHLDGRDFDLARPQRLIGEICSDRGIRCLDLLAAFRAAAPREQLYLPGGDVHFNRHGHALAARTVARSLISPGDAMGLRPD